MMPARPRVHPPACDSSGPTPTSVSPARARSGDDLKGTELPYRAKHHLGAWTVELFPAGHVLGSAMIRVSNGTYALAYTRDADHGLPLSDHADFDELVSFAERCRAGVVHVTHGSKRFAEELGRRAIRAEFLHGKPQLRLF